MRLVEKLSDWLEGHLGEHITLKLFGYRIVIYGFNAMHVAINISTQRWGYICFHPPIHMFGRFWPWYFYLSPNATPWAATFAIGPGISRQEKFLSEQHRKLWGHNFRVDEEHYEMMQSLKSLPGAY